MGNFDLINKQRNSISGSEYNKTNDETGTCSTTYATVLIGIYKRFKDTFFFSYIIQFILVYLMYMNVGNGHYWKVLFYASLFGLIASVIENFTLAYECSEKYISLIDNSAPTYLIVEVFWILTEYSIPYLNLIKMKAIAKSKVAKTITYVIYALFIPFAIARLCIGYSRMKKRYLDDDTIQVLHGFAFLIMGVADLICTVFIIIFINKYNDRSSTHGNDLTDHIQQSSYTILITVDVVSLLLSVLYIFVTFFNTKNDEKKLGGLFSNDSVLPFHCLKSVFLLILATDALLFKYGASNNTSLRNSSENVTTNNINESSFRNTNKSRISTYKPNESSIGHLNSSTIRSPKVVSMSAFGYNPSNDIYSQTSNSRESIENLNNSRMPLNSESPNEIDIRPCPSEQFGFLHHGEYNELIFKDNQMQMKY
ncbi:hypothetical protein BCR36DRAFT_584617 [Piromyces finnis]|uniref:Uncharacterized protein n=1 Tax=Piromyces finnis TaxID=1754191 RepID=A0A1Y1V5S2_9FUNG|nr:hypothetical protein BCR36DRAFT_584617 [Piromyces finnis]|eukprot:ORX47917.1 hypothetical protein BCR36DRAFT_584617 [Piromyces finnis]